MDKLDPNVAFGAFTYERIGTDGTGSGGQNNPFRELGSCPLGWCKSCG